MQDREKVFEDIKKTIIDLGTSEDLKELVEKAVSQGIPVKEIAKKGLREGLSVVGEKYESGEYFLAELSHAGEIASTTLEVLKPHTKGRKGKNRGSIILGTVEGDMHDIGKNIIKLLMMSQGWKVHDLGIDVTPQEFTDEVKKFKPDVLGLTSLLTTTLPMIKETIDKLKKENLRQNVKIIAGGAAVTEAVVTEMNADAYATNAAEGIRKCEEWIE